MAPFRLADTRAAAGTYALDGPSIAGGSSAVVPVRGQDGVPADATAAVLNVTATNPTRSGFLTAYPGGTAVPATSNLNFVAGQTVANLVTVPVGADGTVGIYNLAGSTDVVVDLEGYFAPGAGTTGLYNALVPARVTDTRPGSGQVNAGNTPGPGGNILVPVRGLAGVPPTGVSAVVLNVTAANASAATYLTAFPGTTPLPTASNLNVLPGQVVPNRAIVAVGGDGMVDIHNLAGSTDVVVDVTGWFTDGSDPSSTGARFTPLAPTRIADTRAGSGLGATLGAGATRSLSVSSLLGLPAGSVAVAANVTATDASKPAYLTVYPSSASRPMASDLNWVAGQQVPNLTVATLGPDGGLDVFNMAGSVDVIVDVFGYWS